MWWWILGGLCVFAALGIVWYLVTELTLGKDSSRFAGAVFGGGAYFYVARFAWGVSGWAQALVLIPLAAFALYFGYRAWSNKEEEFKKAASGGWLLAAVALLFGASYAFSLT